MRAATWMTAGVSSPAILNMFGIISRRPCDAVNVVASAPFCSDAVDRAGRARLGLHLDDVGTVPHRFGLRAADQSSQCSAIGEAGVIG